MANSKFFAFAPLLGNKPAAQKARVFIVQDDDRYCSRLSALYPSTFPFIDRDFKPGGAAIIEKYRKNSGWVEVKNSESLRLLEAAYRHNEGCSSSVKDVDFDMFDRVKMAGVI